MHDSDFGFNTYLVKLQCQKSGGTAWQGAGKTSGETERWVLCFRWWSHEYVQLSKFVQLST